MQIDKSSIGKKLYIIETKQDSTVVAHYGELISILPKYMFLDKFSSKYSREQTYLFETNTIDNIFYIDDYVYFIV